MEEKNVDVIESLKNDDGSKKVQKASGIARLYELRDEMSAGIDNVKNVINQQTKLIKIIEDVKDAEFDEFVKQLKASIVDYNKQIKVMEEKVARLDKVLEMYETQHKVMLEHQSEEFDSTQVDINELITNLLLSFGVIK